MHQTVYATSVAAFWPCFYLLLTGLLCPLPIRLEMLSQMSGSLYLCPLEATAAYQNVHNRSHSFVCVHASSLWQLCAGK